MVSLYVRRINAGLMDIEQVPTLWRERVREIIEQPPVE